MKLGKPERCGGDQTEVYPEQANNRGERHGIGAELECVEEF